MFKQASGVNEVEMGLQPFNQFAKLSDCDTM